MRTNRNTAIFVIAVFILAALPLTGCQKSYAPAPKATPTLLSNGFSTPLPTDSAMNDLVAMGEQTATAAAQQTAAAPVDVETTPVTDGAVTVTPASETPENDATELPSPTPTLPVIATNTPTIAPTVAAPSPTAIPTTKTSPTTPPNNGMPVTYSLQQGEFPYCIARRFDVNPDELLTLNGLTPDQGHIYYPGFTLKIPQTGHPFPTTRALHPHPTTYTVNSEDETIYSVACYYGDIDPMLIVQANHLIAPYTLHVGQTLQIP
jgi:LysM repeat protein